MKLPKPKQLKSGNWRIQLQIDGERYSCTGSTKKEAQEKAKQIFAGVEMEKRLPLTLGRAIDKYIEAKTATLSPSTIRGYKSVRRNYFPDIINENISDLTQADIQLAMSSLAAKGLSPKTIKNAHGLLNSTFEMFRPNFQLRTRLPEGQKTEMRIFSEAEIKKVFEAAKGDKYELPILLAAWLGLRMSEIRGLKYGDLKEGKLHIHTAVVRDSEGKDVEKGTKTTSGDRWIKCPGAIQHLIVVKRLELEDAGKDKHEISETYICPWKDITIYKNFIRICKKAEVEPCRFHDLRHFMASEGHALGIPNKYLMKRMGHKTENMLQNVYQHTISDVADEFDDLIDEKMRKLYEG